MSEYTAVEKCPLCKGDELQVIDHRFDRDEQCHEQRIYCILCEHDWWEKED